MDVEEFVRRQRFVGDVGLSDQRRRGPGARIERRGQALGARRHRIVIRFRAGPTGDAVALGTCIPGQGKPCGRRQDRGNRRLRKSMSHDRLLNV